MVGMIIDVLSAVGIGAGVKRGLRRQLSGQLARLAMLGLAVLIGCGGFQVVARFLTEALPISGESAGPLGFITTFLASWAGLGVVRRKLKRSGRSMLEDWLEGKIPDRADRMLGGVVGGAKGGLAMVIGVGALSAAPLDGLRNAIQEDSIAGRAVTSLLAVRAAPEDPAVEP